MSREAVYQAVLELVEALPAKSVERAAQAVIEADVAKRGSGVVSAIAHQGYERMASRLVAAWSQADDVGALELASMLRMAAAARAGALRDTRLDVVWTGPGTSAVPSRSTEAVVLEVVASARHQLLLVTYAAFRYPPLVAALGEAAQRGVRTQVLVETRAGAGPLLTLESSTAFVGIPAVTMYEWPASRRRTSASGARGRLHAKLVVADRNLAFVTSANLTGSGIEENIECGLLVRGGPVPGRLADHVETLVRQGVFQVLTGGVGSGPIST